MQKVGNIIKCDNDLVKDTDGMINRIQRTLSKQAYADDIKYLKKGIRLMNPKLSFGYDGDDFIRNMITVRMDRKGYKVPRFLAQHFIKKIQKLSK